MRAARRHRSFRRCVAEIDVHLPPIGRPRTIAEQRRQPVRAVSRAAHPLDSGKRVFGRAKLPRSSQGRRFARSRENRVHRLILSLDRREIARRCRRKADAKLAGRRLVSPGPTPRRHVIPASQALGYG